VTILLDTHTILWFWWDDPQLSAAAKALILDPANRKLVSPATPWEVAIKVSLKKLDIGGPYQGFFPRQMALTNFDYLAVTDDHLAAVAALPFHHRDPFDRLIAAQAMTEGVPVVSADAAFDPYGVTRLW
jgi:PIN domain nuclease of toxin-antitoxin system